MNLARANLGILAGFRLNNKMLGEDEILPLEFYLPATAVTLLWAAVLVMAFTRRLKRGLGAAISQLAEKVARHRVAGGPFVELQQACSTATRSREQLRLLCQRVRQLKAELRTESTAPGD